MNAIALNSSAFNAARIVGPAIGGVLIGSVGIAACYFLNGVSYVAVVAGLLLHAHAARGCRPPSRATGWRGSARGRATSSATGASGRSSSTRRCCPSSGSRTSC